MNKEPEYVALTLRWCNGLRKKNGKKPLKKLPRGRMFEATSCPCGKATGAIVGYGFYDFNGKEGIIPYSVRQFVDAFDDGRFPQYQLPE
jgi:hypothetical protein